MTPNADSESVVHFGDALLRSRLPACGTRPFRYWSPLKQRVTCPACLVRIDRSET
jgi:hypothetical protein